jgi:hypothetical protein
VIGMGPVQPDFRNRSLPFFSHTWCSAVVACAR